MRIPIVPFDRGQHWTPVKLCPYGEGHARFGRVTIVVTMTWCGHKIVAPTQSGLECVVRKPNNTMLCFMNFIQLVCCYVLLKMFASNSHTKSFETPFLIIFSYYAWVSCDLTNRLYFNVFRSNGVW